jgi:hypothetical protein
MQIPAQVEQTISLIRDFLFIVGVPSVAAFIIWGYAHYARLLKETVDAHERRIAVLDKMQFPNVVRDIDAYTGAANRRISELEAQISALENSGATKSELIAELTRQLAEAAGARAVWQKRRHRLSKSANRDAVRAFVLSLDEQERDEYFAEVFRSGVTQGQKAYVKEAFDSPEEEQKALRDAADDFGTDWAQRKGVLDQWKNWRARLSPTASAHSTVERPETCG